MLYYEAIAVVAVLLAADRVVYINVMQIGFVNFNTDEKKRIAEMMQLLNEPEAVEELGIGRVRDHFSNTLFPGTSSLQHHAKYFVVLPWIYLNAINSKEMFGNLEDVDRYIRQEEVRLTWRLVERNPDDHGITGRTFVDQYSKIDEAVKDYAKYVKYDPTYVYSSGLHKYGIVSAPNVKSLICDLNKMNHMEQTEDAEGKNGYSNYIDTCGVEYDLSQGLDMCLTVKESDFLKGKIVSSCCGSMLEKLITSGKVVCEDYFQVGQYVQDCPVISEVYHRSVLFSRLIHLLDWRYNYAYYMSFAKEAEARKCEAKYRLLKDNDYRDCLADREGYEDLFGYIRSIDPDLTEFCEKCYVAILDDDTQTIDGYVISREKEVKKKRRKISSAAYKDKVRVIPQPITYRWLTVSTIVNEIATPMI